MVKALFDNLIPPGPLRMGATKIQLSLIIWLRHQRIILQLVLMIMSPTPAYNITPTNVVQATFYVLGADGTVGANENSIKIIGEETEN